MSKDTASKKRILVTGASGFIGSNLVKRLVKDGYDVTTLGRASSVPKQLRDLPIKHVCCDITNKEQLDESLNGYDIVFHLAGLVSYRARDQQRQNAVNVIGTKNVMDAALRHNVERVIHTSSIAAMGIPEEGKTADETLEYNLGGKGLNYCDSKYAAELEVKDAWNRGLNVIILSPGITLGEGDTHSHHHAIIKAIANRKIIFVPQGGVTFSDIEDVVDAHVNAIENGRCGERYAIVSENLSFMDAARKAASVFKSSPQIFVLPPWLLMMLATVSENWMKLVKKDSPVSTQQAWLANHKIFFSSDKAEKELDFKPTKFETTIKRTVKFYTDLN